MMYKGMGGGRAGWGWGDKTGLPALSAAAAHRNMTRIITLYDSTSPVSVQMSYIDCKVCFRGVHMYDQLCLCSKMFVFSKHKVGFSFL